MCSRAPQRGDVAISTDTNQDEEVSGIIGTYEQSSLFFVHSNPDRDDDPYNRVGSRSTAVPG